MKTCFALVFMSITCAPMFAQMQDAWAGQVRCQLNVQTNEYAHQEVQTWTVNGSPTDDTKTIYPATWSVSGQGGLQRTQGAQVLAGRWNSSVPGMNAPLRIFVRASDGRLVIKGIHAPLVAPAATNAVRQVGASQSNIVYAANEWILPIIEDVDTSTNVSGTGMVVVPPTLMPMQSGTSGTATCTWNFTKGTNGPKVVAPLGTGLPQNNGGLPTVNTPPTAASTDSVSVTSAGSAVQSAPSTTSGGTTLPLSNVNEKAVSKPLVVPISLSPSSGQQATGALAVTVSGRDWASGDLPDFGPGIKVICSSPVSSTSATYVVAITPTASLGSHIATFTNHSGQTVKSTFNVTANTPSFVVQPDNGQQGQVLSLTLPDPYGQWYDPNQIGANIHIDFGGDILLSNISFKPTFEKLQVSISPTAALGSRTIVLTQDAKLQCPVGMINPHTGKFEQTSQIATPVSYYFLATFTINPATSQSSTNGGQQQSTSGNSGTSSCNATVHRNGLGQTYKDCLPLGQPGTATYTQVMAVEAASAFNNDPGTVSDISCTQVSGQQSAYSVSATANGACAVWTYNGVAAGHVHLDGAGACTCPSVNDGSWN